MLKSIKKPKIEIDETIDEKQKHSFIEQKILQAKKTLKRVGLPQDLQVHTS